MNSESVKRIGRRQFQVDIHMSGLCWSYTLRGGLFCSDQRALEAGRDMAKISHDCIKTATMVREAMKSFDKIEYLFNPDKSRANRNAFLQVAAVFEELAVSVPRTWDGLSTGSESLSAAEYLSLNHGHQDFMTFMLSRCPMPSGDANFERFKIDWAQNLTRAFEPSPNIRHVMHIHAEHSRIKNVPALKARTEAWKDVMLSEMNTMITAHHPEFLPVVRNPAVIRGHHAHSLMRLMAPQIESKLQQIANPEQREKMNTRLRRLADLVEKDVEHKVSRSIENDVEASLQALEEGVLMRLGVVPSAGAAPENLNGTREATIDTEYADEVDPRPDVIC